MLERDGEEVARATTIVKFDPNTPFPQHVHGGGLESKHLKVSCLILNQEKNIS